MNNASERPHWIGLCNTRQGQTEYILWVGNNVKTNNDKKGFFPVYLMEYSKLLATHIPYCSKSQIPFPFKDCWFLMQVFGRFGGEVLKERGWWVVGQSHLWNIFDQKIQNLHFFLLIPIRMSCHQLQVYIESLFSAVWGWVGITIRTIV